MKKTTKMALAFVALSTTLAGTALADKRNGGREMGMGGGMMQPLELADADKNGEITFDEFKKAAGDRFVLADANKDGKVTVEEMAAAIEKMRAEEMAKRMITRFDADSDGAVTLAEIENGQKEIYALMDRNDDGKLVEDELRRMGGKHKGFGWGRSGGSGNN
ncbi:MAG: acid-shock protein [Rhizobiaceae bacterium]